MALNTQDQNALSMMMDLAAKLEAVVRQAQTIQLFNTQNGTLGSYTNGDLTAIPTFDHLTTTKINGFMAAYQALITADTTNGFINKSLQMLSVPPKS
jgi:hypothetical protein